MKNLLIIIGLLTIIGCGNEKVTLTSGKDGINGLSGTNGLDGANGQDGYNSLITVTQLNAEQEVCQSGGGILVASGLDLNRNDLLEMEEVLPATLVAVCNGLSGPMGPQGEVGPAGADGLDGIDGLDGEDGQDGQDGAQGLQGPAGENSAILSSFVLADTCQSVGDGFYAKKNGANANIYTDAQCTNDNKVASLVENSDEVYMVDNIIFLVENSESMKLFKINL